MIDPEILSKALHAALRTGGDFAEVYAEDKRSSSADLDDGKVEQVTSAVIVGAGIRVVIGRNHRVCPHRRPVRAAACSRQPRPPRLLLARAAAAPTSLRFTREAVAAREPWSAYPGLHRQGAQGRAA